MSAQTRLIGNLLELSKSKEIIITSADANTLYTIALKHLEDEHGIFIHHSPERKTVSNLLDIEDIESVYVMDTDELIQHLTAKGILKGWKNDR